VADFNQVQLYLTVARQRTFATPDFDLGGRGSNLFRRAKDFNKAYIGGLYFPRKFRLGRLWQELGTVFPRVVPHRAIFSRPPSSARLSTIGRDMATAL
jgi:hypothetical protein